jgi:hypothetical protein
MAAEVEPAHVSVVHLSLNMVQPTMSEFQVTPATPIALLGVAPITPARKVPCPAAGGLHGVSLQGLAGGCLDMCKMQCSLAGSGQITAYSSVQFVPAEADLG